MDDQGLRGLNKASDSYEAPKPWEDLTDAERIERLREQVKQYQHQLYAINKLFQLLKSHDHEQDGRVFFKQSHHEANLYDTAGIVGAAKLGYADGKTYF